MEHCVLMRYFVHSAARTCDRMMNGCDLCLAQGVQFYPPWRPREQNKMRLQDGDKKKTELPIEHVLAIGAVDAMLTGGDRKGFVPADSV